MAHESNDLELRNAVRGLIAGGRFPQGSTMAAAAQAVADRGISGVSDDIRSTFKKDILPMLDEKSEGLMAEVKAGASEMLGTATEAVTAAAEDKAVMLDDMIRRNVQANPYRALAYSAVAGFVAALLVTR
jgi:hypothetical protein